MENIEVENVVCELRGYLKALQRLSGKKTRFFLEHLSPSEGSLEDCFIQWYKEQFPNSKSRINVRSNSYRELADIINNVLLQGPISNKSIPTHSSAFAYYSKIFMEDINLLIEDVSYTIDNSISSPLVDSNTLSIYPYGVEKTKSVVIAIEIKEHILFIGFISDNPD